MNRYLRACAAALLFPACLASQAAAQGAPAASPAEQALADAAAEQKYTFLVFFKDDGPATRAMSQAVKRGLESRSDRATVAFVNVANPAEKGLIDRFGVSRAPMPLTIAVAPNGAITSLSPGRISEQQIAKSFVSPAAAHCMKSMQDGQIVLACVQSSSKLTVPPGVKDLCNDSEFKSRSAVAFIHANDPAEAQFLQHLQVDTSSKTPTTVILAPPGVLVGKFGFTATKDQMVAALHKAGKCCDDPNCKHGQASQPATQPAAGTSRPANQGPGTRRN